VLYIKGSDLLLLVRVGVVPVRAWANDQLARSAVVERAWASVTAPKVVRNDSEVSWSSWLRS